MKTFQIPAGYRSPLISAVKTARRGADKMKKDFAPTLLNFGPVKIYLARHFGFCYGVENAIDIAFRTIDENPGRRIFLLSEMIHNPKVNSDLQERGIRFLQDTGGRQLIPFDTLDSADIVITPAFGTSLEIASLLEARGIHTEAYNTTCPFVEKVWNRSGQLAGKDFTVIIHGKPGHEETRATFSHAAAGGPALIIKDMAEAITLAGFLKGETAKEEFSTVFAGRFSAGFDPGRDLQRIGVVNQTTMLAAETQGIADYLKTVIVDMETKEINLYPAGAARTEKAFADTRDTLCYATSDNQTAVAEMLQTEADLALVVGGYNSSNTSHLVELCESKLPTWYVDGPEKLLSAESIRHFNFHAHTEETVTNWIPEKQVLRVLVTSGASCPDAVVENVVRRLISFFPGSRDWDEVAAEFAA